MAAEGGAARRLPDSSSSSFSSSCSAWWRRRRRVASGIRPFVTHSSVPLPPLSLLTRLLICRSFLLIFFSVILIFLSHPPHFLFLLKTNRLPHQVPLVTRLLFLTLFLISSTQTNSNQASHMNSLFLILLSRPSIFPMTFSGKETFPKLDPIIPR